MPAGSCLCGAVRFEVEGELPAPNGCHCSQCRKTSGHYWVSTDLPEAAVTIDLERREAVVATGDSAVLVAALRADGWEAAVAPG